MICIGYYWDNWENLKIDCIWGSNNNELVLNLSIIIRLLLLCRMFLFFGICAETSGFATFFSFGARNQTQNLTQLNMCSYHWTTLAISFYNESVKNKSVNRKKGKCGRMLTIFEPMRIVCGFSLHCFFNFSNRFKNIKLGVKKAKLCNFKSILTGHWWFTHVILATPGSRDQENHSSKPSWANSLGDPILKTNTHQKKGWRSGPSGKVPF
jgi:hypothetical protein